MCWSKKQKRESIKVVACSGYGRSRCWLYAIYTTYVGEFLGLKAKDEGERQAINSFTCIGKCCYHPGNNFISVFFRLKGKKFNV